MSYFYDNRDHDDDEPYFPNFNRESDHKEFNKRILLTAIVSLTLVLVLVFALHLYTRFVLKRQARRRAAIHQLTLTVAQAHTLSTESNKVGLSPTIISTLPTFLFKQKQPQQKQNQQHSSYHVVECSVCLSVFEDEESVKLLPNCKHTFHVGCIDTWLASNSTCPVCRTKVEPGARIEPQPREGPIGSGLYGAPSAPLPVEGTSDGGDSPERNSRLSSFRRILSREKSSKRIQPSSCDDDINHDLERQ